MLDCSKYCHRLMSVDAEERTCVVEPGIVLDVLNDSLLERTASASALSRRPT